MLLLSKTAVWLLGNNPSPTPPPLLFFACELSVWTRCNLKTSFYTPLGLAVLICVDDRVHGGVCASILMCAYELEEGKKELDREEGIQPAHQLFTVLNIYGFATNIIEDFNTLAVFHTMMSYPCLSRSHTQPRLKRGCCISWQSHYLPQSLLLLTSLVAYLEKYAYLLHLPLQLHNYTQ